MKMNQKHQGPPIFILSAERSGSTLLRYIIDTHPEICSPAEIYLGQLCQDLYWVTYYTAGAVANVSSETEKELMVLGEVRRIVSGVMDKYAQAKNKQMWCEKSPANLHNLNVLERVFPDGKYVCLYRNCMDVVHSQMEANRQGFWPALAKYVHRHPDNIVAAMVENWIDRAQELMTFEREHPKKCFRLKYESLVYEPVANLNAMFDFLGVEWDASLLDSVFKSKHDLGNGDVKVTYSEKIDKSSIGKGSTILRDKIPAELLEKMNRILEELGYPVVGPDWDHAPSPYAMAEATTTTPLAQTSPLADAGGLDEIFSDYFPRRLKERGERVSEINAVCKFVVNGSAGSDTWVVDLTRPGGKITAGDGRADCTVIVLEKDLLGMINGKVNPGEAYLQGAVRVSGNPEVALQVGQVLFGG
jgi:protein-tyrosine sulfotransferase